MSRYVETLRRICFSGFTEPAELHALSLELAAAAPDPWTRHQAHRLSQEAFDRTPSAFRDRLWRLWNALPAADRPEVAPVLSSRGAAPPRVQSEPDTTGMTKHLPRR